MARHEPSFDRLVTFGALISAAQRAAKGHHRTVEVADFLLHLEPEVLALERECHDAR
jgi:hypothetical protein